MFCSKCGTKIPDDSLYCYKCGEKILESMDDSSNTMDKIPEKGNDNTIVDRSVEVKRNTELDSPKQIHKEKQSKDGYLFSKEYWLTWQGRRNRKPYFFIGLALNIISKIIMVAIMSVMSRFLLLALVLIVLEIFITYLGIINLGKRLHDMDLNAWYGAIFNIVVLGWSIFSPESTIAMLINIVVGLGVLLIPGTNGENRYGKNPLEE